MGPRNPKKNWFLTYPQSEMTMAVLLERLQVKKELDQYLICCEQHQDGHDHLHAYIRFSDSGIPLQDAPGFFSVGDKSGNYQPCRSVKSVIKYVSKDGNYLCNFDIDTYLSKKGKLSMDTIKTKGVKRALEDGDIGISSIKHYQLARSILCEPYSHDDVRGVWIHGPPGIGKSRYARDHYNDIYLKPQNKWFDGYEGQDTILLDDFDKPGACLGHYLKIWTDRYACTGEVKGSICNLQHKQFVITSNYTIEDIFEDDPILIEALNRRFHVIKMGDNIEYLDKNTGQYAPGFNP